MVSIWIDKQKRLLLNALFPKFSSDPSFLAATDLSIQTDGSPLRLTPDLVICWGGHRPRPDQEETLLLDLQVPTITIAILFSPIPLSSEILEIYASAQITYLIGLDPDPQDPHAIPTQIWVWEAGQYKTSLYQLHRAQLGITFWQGSFEGSTRTWLRWRDLQDHLLLTGEEQAQQERDRADRIGDFLKLVTQQKAQQYSDQTQPTHPVQLLFPTAVYQRQIEAADQINPAMIESAYQIRSQDLEGQRQSKLHSGPQGYYTSIYTFHRLYERQEFKILSQLVLEFATEYAQHLGIDRATHRLDFTTFWININEKYSYHEPHYHKNCFISGVYYLAVSQGSGRFIFHDPREHLRIIDPHFSQRNAINAERVRWQPQPGQIYLFPAWLLHSVEHHLEDADRITVSFNLRLSSIPSEEEISNT